MNLSVKLQFTFIFTLDTRNYNDTLSLLTLTLLQSTSFVITHQYEFSQEQIELTSIIFLQISRQNESYLLSVTSFKTYTYDS